MAPKPTGTIDGLAPHLLRRALRSGIGAYTGLRIRAAYPALPVLVSPDDDMYDGYQAEDYFRVGADALHLVRQSLMVAGRPPPARILDLPCGHGRVLRWMRAAWPTAEITACDINRAGVDWCVATMGARACYSAEDLATVDLGGPYDLIWVGSLLTHLDADRWAGVLEPLADRLVPGGVAVWTTHGHQAREYARGTTYGLEPAALEAAIKSWATSGFGYARYPGDAGYGVSFATPAWVRSVLVGIPNLIERALWVAGWDHHQDVFAVQRVDSG